MRHTFPPALLLALACVVPGRPALAADALKTCAGFIDALPAVVSTPGTWCLRRNLATTITSGAAITLDGSNVSLACHGHRINGVPAGATSAVGIATGIGTHGAEVTGCTVRAFRIGVQLSGSGHAVRDSRLQQNAVGIETWQYVSPFGSDAPSEVRDNQVVDSGAAGIRTNGKAVVTGNTVDGVADGFVSIGIEALDARTSVIEHNTVRNVDGQGGIRLQGDGAILRHNTVVGIAGREAIGVQCSDGVIHDTVLSGWSQSFAGDCALHDNIVID